MRLKALLAATALTAVTIAAPAHSQQNEVEGGIDREAYGFRQCRDYGERWGRQVCYNTKTTSWISVAGILPVPITRTKYRTHQINCTKPHSKSTLRGKVAAEYCPQLPGLAPAPFLSLND